MLTRAFPRVRETTSPELYREVGRIRLIVVLVGIALNALALLSLDELGIDRSVWFPLQVPNNLMLLVSGGLGAWMWKRPLAASTLRLLTQVCIVAEMATFLINLSMFGSVNSHMIFGALFLALMYRVLFDFSLGLLACLVLVLGLSGLVVLEMTGVIPPQVAVLGRPDVLYLSAQREFIALLFIVGVFLLAFWGVNWAVLQLRHRERAIRILRETLAATEPGKLGRHTGRTLADTYVVGTQIGVGGMGEVYKGHHRRTRRPVAIKLLHPHLVDDPVLLARFRREAEIVGSVGSEHIVEILDIDQDDDQPFMVFELLDGDSLRVLIERDGPMSPNAAAVLFEQLGAGLDAAHRTGVVHRDLKPENIIIEPSERGPKVKILDFGISKILGNVTAITHEVGILGTPDFMAPEQAMGKVLDVDCSADIFSLGAVLYYVLTGHRPFQASSIPALLGCICDEEPPPLVKRRPDLGPNAGGLQAVLRIAMAKRPQQRYESASEFAADLLLAADGTLPASVVERAARVEQASRTASIIGDTSVSAHGDTAHDDAATTASDVTTAEAVPAGTTATDHRAKCSRSP